MSGLHDHHDTSATQRGRMRDEETHPLVRQLSRFARLSPNDIDALIQLGSRLRPVEACAVLARDGDPIDAGFLVLDGIACQHVHRANGARQILSLLLPGDLCDLDLMHVERWDHGVAALTSCQVVRIPLGTLEDLLVDHPAIGMALRRAKLAREARARAWLTGFGVGSVGERMAHLFCEIDERMREVGVADRDGCHLTFSQATLGECVGASTVHVNRTLQDLRRSGLIEYKGGWLRLLDRSRLVQMAEATVRGS